MSDSSIYERARASLEANKVKVDSDGALADKLKITEHLRNLKGDINHVPNRELLLEALKGDTRKYLDDAKKTIHPDGTEVVDFGNGVTVRKYTNGTIEHGIWKKDDTFSGTRILQDGTLTKHKNEQGKIKEVIQKETALEMKIVKKAVPKKKPVTTSTKEPSEGEKKEKKVVATSMKPTKPTEVSIKEVSSDKSPEKKPSPQTPVVIPAPKTEPKPVSLSPVASAHAEEKKSTKSVENKTPPTQTPEKKQASPQKPETSTQKPTVNHDTKVNANQSAEAQMSKETKEKNIILKRMAETNVNFSGSMYKINAHQLTLTRIQDGNYHVVSSQMGFGMIKSPIVLSPTGDVLTTMITIQKPMIMSFFGPKGGNYRIYQNGNNINIVAA